MNRFTLSPSKRIIGLVILLLLVGLPVLLLYGVKPNQPKEQPIQQNNERNELPPNTNIVASPSPYSNTPQKWKIYSGNGFNFQYPPGWKAQELTIANGDLIIVKPEALTEEIIYPQFIVQTQSAANGALERKTSFLEALGLKKSETTVNDLSAIKYSGTIPFKTSGGRTVQEPIQDTTYLFVKEETLYLLKYEYEGSSVNQDLEAYFADFIESFKFN